MTWLAWYIAVTFGLASLAMAWWPCGCLEQLVPPWCDLCQDGTDNDVSVTFSGIGDLTYLGNDCDCSVLNATFIVPPHSTGASSGSEFCRWKKRHGNHAEIDCGGLLVGFAASYAIGYASNTITHTLDVWAGVAAYAQWTAASIHFPPPKWDCEGTYGLGGGTQSTPKRVCDFDGATATIN